jgi:hypothetical protein
MMCRCESEPTPCKHLNFKDMVGYRPSFHVFACLDAVEPVSIRPRLEPCSATRLDARVASGGGFMHGVGLQHSTFKVLKIQIPGVWFLIT